ncbi:zinc finger, CCHC-type containing protein [Tanacetum coccineum]
MDVAIKHMASNFAKLEKFEGVNFRRWKKKMNFLLSGMSVVYVLTTPMPDDGGDNPTVEQNVKTSKELWDTLEAKYMAEDASSKKFFVSNFTNYKMTDSRPVLKQYNELLAFMSTSKLNDSILWHARLGHVHFKRMQDMSKDRLIPAFDMDTENDLCDLHATPSLGNKKYFVTFIDDASRFCYVYLLHTKDEGLDKLKSVGIIHETTAPYTPQQNGISERKNRVLKEMVHSMLSYSGLSQGFWGEAMAVVILPDPKLKTLGERGIECIFVGYAKHSKAFRFYVIEPNESVAINSIIESMDAIFDENRFSSVPRPSQRSLQLEPELKSKRHRTPKDFGPEFQLYLIEGTKDEVSDQHSYFFNVEDDPKIYDEAMKTLGCKWIFKRKLKVDGTVEKFKARVVIQGFKQNSGIDYFDTYAPVARISTIRLLIAIASFHSLIIHQMDVKTAFLNGELDEDVYMNQPQGFIMPSNENKVCKLIKSLYGLKQAPKQWHQKFDEVVLSNGYLLNQADKCVYSKFDESGKGVIICLYFDDMLIFGTDQVQVGLTKEFLSSRFFMKDMGEADVILGIRITHESNGIAISQSHYIEKAVSQLKYSRVIGYLMYDMTCTWPDIAFVVGKLSRYTSNPGTQHWQAIQRVQKYLKKTMDYRLIYTGYPLVLEGYTDASWISNTEDNSSTSGWVFLLGGAVSWASKKQNCITSSTMESKFVALATTAPISIRCNSDATSAKVYSQMYNGKSRHMGVKHSMIRELITNGVVSIEFVRNCTTLGRIVGNLVQLRVQFIPDNGARVYSSVSRNSELKDIHQSDGFSFEPSADMLLSGLADDSGH